MATDRWNNENKLDIRSKIAIRILLLIVKILEPYKFNHEFSKDFEAIDKTIKEAE
jgi:hypothetical protein